MEMIKEDLFRKQIKKGLSGGYLFFGEEDYMKSFAMGAAREAICPDETFAIFNDIRIDALDYSPSALLDALVPPPMMTEQKIVTVSGLNIGSFRQDEVAALIEAISTIKEYDYNVLIISVPAGQIDEGRLPKAPSNILKTLSEYLTPVRFEAVSDTRLSSWVGKHFEHNGAYASPDVCYSLIKHCGRSMYILSEETEKLSYYVLSKGRKEVTLDDIRAVSSPELSADTFALANAITDGKYEAAMKALEVMRFRRADPVIVFSEVSRTVCELYMVNALNMQGISVSEIMSATGIRSDYKVRLYLNSLQGKSDKKLKRAVELCSEADLALKNSAQGYSVIERLIGSL